MRETLSLALGLEKEKVGITCTTMEGIGLVGREEGIGIGEMRMLIKQVKKGRVTVEEAAEDAEMTVEEFKKAMENTPLQAV